MDPSSDPKWVQRGFYWQTSYFWEQVNKQEHELKPEVAQIFLHSQVHVYTAQALSFPSSTKELFSRHHHYREREEILGKFKGWGQGKLIFCFTFEFFLVHRGFNLWPGPQKTGSICPCIRHVYDEVACPLFPPPARIVLPSANLALVLTPKNVPPKFCVGFQIVPLQWLSSAMWRILDLIMHEGYRPWTTWEATHSWYLTLILEAFFYLLCHFGSSRYHPYSKTQQVWNLVSFLEAVAVIFIMALSLFLG